MAYHRFQATERGFLFTREQVVTFLSAVGHNLPLIWDWAAVAVRTALADSAGGPVPGWYVDYPLSAFLRTMASGWLLTHALSDIPITG